MSIAATVSTLKDFVVQRSPIRRTVLRVLERVNPGDISIRHHWTGDAIRVHSFRHKGYWWSGKNREFQTVLRFQEMISPGDVVIEVGGHIGYFSVLFARQVGDTGKVHVFEPGINNLPYLQQNVAKLSQVVIHESVASSVDGFVDFWIEDLTGQNNSMIETFEGFERNLAASGVTDRIKRTQVSVKSIRLDSFVENEQLTRIDFVKIDVEGAEILVLEGARALIGKFRPNFMVEINSNVDVDKIEKIFDGLNYRTMAPEGFLVALRRGVTGNVFFLPQ
jgi:FkbM family methyltransferase